MGKASKRKRGRRLGEPLELPRNVPDSLRGRDHRLVRNPAGAKISESLADLIRPFTTGQTDLEEFRTLVGLGAIAWNLANLSAGSPREALQLLNDESIRERQFFEGFVSQLILRKRELFPRDRRIVAGWDVALRPDGTFFLTAASAGTE
jgi:hypothetical protein